MDFRKVCWPHTIHDANRYGCMAQYIKKIEAIKLFDLTVKPAKSWYLYVLDDTIMCYSHDDTVLPLDTRPNMNKAIINVIAMEMAKGEINVSPNTKMRVATSLAMYGKENIYMPADTMNAWMHAARIKCARIKDICRSFNTITARSYRLKTGCIKKIQRAWRIAICDPSYMVCTKRLMSEFIVISKI